MAETAAVWPYGVGRVAGRPGARLGMEHGQASGGNADERHAVICTKYYQ